MKISDKTYSRQQFYRAHLTRDYRFDGRFFVAVKTTNIYCRPVCPARKAKLDNLEFFLRADQAEAAGYRPCKRCRPETAPGSPAWIGTSATIRRAMRIMSNSDVELLSVKSIAQRLGISERWFRTLFQQEVGIPPQTYLLNQKLSLARNLLDSTTLPITDIAFSSGFKSIRRFNDAFKQRFGQSPSSIKQHGADSNTLTVYLRYRPPLSWEQLLGFLGQRALPAVERVNDKHEYERLFCYQGVPGWVRVSKSDGYKLRVDFRLARSLPALELITRIRELFDLDADPMLIENDLKRDAILAPFVEENAGLRVPGCWCGFEIAVRAIIGQKISVKAARTILIRLVELCGERQTFDQSISLTHCFPTPVKILKADLSGLGLTHAKIETLKQLAQLVVTGRLMLDGTEDYEVTCKKLLSIKGVGPWTLQYIAMRGLRDPNAFPETDLELKKKIQALNLNANLWIPWRAYAAILLFSL